MSNFIHESGSTSPSKTEVGLPSLRGKPSFSEKIGLYSGGEVSLVQILSTVLFKDSQRIFTLFGSISVVKDSGSAGYESVFSKVSL
tara:strand:- start:3950 stop:4207 length:258 start_codon:yes stop_codon:yes gene_type:complete